MERSPAVFFVSVIVAVVAYVLIDMQINERQQSQGSSVQVIRAEVDIPAGTTLSRDHIERAEVPASPLPAQILEAQVVEVVLGQTVRRDVARGTLMTWDDLESRGQNLRDDIPADHRAFTVEVDSSAAQAGQLRPGDHVDVLGVFADDRGSICKTVLEDVRVLSVGGNRLVAGLVPPFATITLDLTPEECQIMALAVENATISMTLRGTGDRGATKLPPTHLDSLSR